MEDGVLVEHWDVIEDEATRAQSKSGKPMFRQFIPRIGNIAISTSGFSAGAVTLNRFERKESFLCGSCNS